MDVEGFEGLALEGYAGLLGSSHTPAYIFIELVTDSLARSGFGHTVRGELKVLAAKGPGYRVFRGDLAVEITPEMLAASGDEGEFVGQKDCQGNYILVRSDVSVPTLGRTYDACKPQCC